MKHATGADDLALAETTWPLPDEDGPDLDTLERALRYGAPTWNQMHKAAEILAAYRALICDGTTTEQTKRLAALRRVWRKLQ